MMLTCHEQINKQSLLLRLAGVDDRSAFAKPNVAFLLPIWMYVPSFPIKETTTCQDTNAMRTSLHHVVIETAIFACQQGHIRHGDASAYPLPWSLCIPTSVAVACGGTYCIRQYLDGTRG